MVRAWFESNPILARIMLAIMLLGNSGFHVVSAGPAPYSRKISPLSVLVSDEVQTCSSVHCILACKKSPTCRGVCYSWSASTCYLSEESSPAKARVLTGTEHPDLTCYISRNCPIDDGYVIYASHCVKLYTTGKNYHEANTTCNNDGAHLYNLKSLQWDQPPLKELNPNDDDTLWWWVGADRLNLGGNFQWSDGTPLEKEVWFGGEPNNGGTSLIEEECAQVYKEYKLADNACSTQQAFICQIDL